MSYNQEFEKADYCAMKEHLDINWSEVLKEGTFEELWTLLLDNITEAVDVYVPKSYTSSNSLCNTHGNFLINGKLKEKIKKGRKAVV